jgi:hypothetical protein
MIQWGIASLLCKGWPKIILVQNRGMRKRKRDAASNAVIHGPVGRVRCSASEPASTLAASIADLGYAHRNARENR